MISFSLIESATLPELSWKPLLAMLPFENENDAFDYTETLDIDYFEWKYAGLDF